MSTSSSSGHRNLQLPAAEHSGIGGAIIENPCGVSFITPHGFVFPIVRSVAYGESTEHRSATYPGERIPYRTNRLGPSFCELW
jgi:hypothetical protein